MNVKKLASILAAIQLVVSTSTFANSRTVDPKDLITGPPQVAKQTSESTFLPFEVKQLANPELWYVDYDWHREHGIEVPPEGIRSPEFVQKLLEAYAWQTPSKKDTPEQFTQKTKTLYADYYGGYGMNGNIGSGRAAAAGILQIKGLSTPLIKTKDVYHSNGAVQSIEAVDEAIWSGVLNSEIKYGSNRVIAVVLTNTFAGIKGQDGVFPRALIIREMAVRPAHFMYSEHRDKAEDQARLNDAIPHLIENLPLPEGFNSTNPIEKLKAGIDEVIHREAVVQAEYFAKRMYFGSDSPSNVEISGKRLDLGDHTSQIGHSQIYRLEELEYSPFGKVEEVQESIGDFVKDLKRLLPSDQAAVLPTQDIVVQKFNKVFENQRAAELVRLTGVPHELVEKLQNSPTLLNLGNTLLRAALIGNTQPVWMDHSGWKNTSTHDINQILRTISKLNTASADELEKNLEPALANRVLRRKLARDFVAFRSELSAAASQLGVSEASLTEYIKLAGQVRNQTRDTLIRGENRWDELWQINDRAIAAPNRQLVQKYVTEQINKNVFDQKDAGALRVVVKQQSLDEQGIKLRQVFDAREGKLINILRVQTYNGKGMFKGRELSSEELSKSVLKLNGSNLGVETQNVKGEKVDHAVEFKIDSPAKIKLGDLLANSEILAPLNLRLEKENAVKTTAPVICSDIFRVR